MEQIYAGIHDAEAADASRRRANAVELLDNLLERELKEKFLPLLEESPADRQVAAAIADENHPVRPLSPYGIAKLSVEKYLFYYAEVHALQYVSLRYGNVYGPRQNPHGEAGVIAIFAEKMLGGGQPVINGELEHYTTVATDFSAFLHGDGLNVPALLESYRQYVRRRGFRAFDTEHLKEGAWHYSLDGYLSFFVERFGHRCFVEVPTGRGRTDILIVWGRRSYIIETKVYTDNWTYAQGKRQLAEYLRSEGLDEGYYVVFSNKHTDEHTLFEDEEIDGKRILTYLVRTNLEPAAG